MDNYFFHIAALPYGAGIFQSINFESGVLPPPPSDSGYRVTTDGNTRVLTISNIDYRTTTSI